MHTRIFRHMLLSLQAHGEPLPRPANQGGRDAGIVASKVVGFAKCQFCNLKRLCCRTQRPDSIRLCKQCKRQLSSFIQDVYPSTRTKSQTQHRGMESGDEFTFDGPRGVKSVQVLRAGLFWESDPGLLRPKRSIMPLDQTAEE